MFTLLDVEKTIVLVKDNYTGYVPIKRSRITTYYIGIKH